MESPLSPVEMARRARRLYADREAVVDGALRLTYREFFERCDRWSAALQRFGIRPGDRVAIIAPNTHAHLETCYAVPQIGAVLVPINYRLIADDFAYLTGPRGSRGAWPSRARGRGGWSTRPSSRGPIRASVRWRSPSAIWSRSTTPAGPPRGPRASRSTNRISALNALYTT